MPARSWMRRGSIGLMRRRVRPPRSSQGATGGSATNGLERDHVVGEARRSLDRLVDDIDRVEVRSRPDLGDSLPPRAADEVAGDRVGTQVRPPHPLASEQPLNDFIVEVEPSGTRRGSRSRAPPLRRRGSVVIRSAPEWRRRTRPSAHGRGRTHGDVRRHRRRTPRMHRGPSRRTRSPPRQPRFHASADVPANPKVTCSLAFGTGARPPC